MALTPQQEAQVLQLLDQQAALLSLANNEGLISSKLGAQKVNISQLPAASTLAPADLFLVRQGTQDKSANVSLVTSTAAGGSLLAVNNLSDVANPAVARGNLLAAALASPTFTGDPKAPTAVQFDSSTSLATTAFVQRALGNYQSYVAVTGTRTLASSESGSFIQASSTGYTITLPAPAANLKYTIYFSSAASLVTVAAPSGQILNFNSSSASLVCSGGTTVEFYCNGTNWVASQYSAGKNSVAPSLASVQLGPIILKGGQANTNVSGVAVVTFAEPFPNAFIAGFTNDSENVATAVAYGGVTGSTTTLTLTYAKNGAASNAAAVHWMAIGY